MVIVTQDRTSHETHFCVKIIATGNKGEVPQSVFIQLKEVKEKKLESSRDDQRRLESVVAAAMNMRVNSLSTAPAVQATLVH